MQSPRWALCSGSSAFFFPSTRSLIDGNFVTVPPYPADYNSPTIGPNHTISTVITITQQTLRIAPGTNMSSIR